MTDIHRQLQQLRELLDRQQLAVLSSHRQGQPYASIVAFAAAADLTRIFFATPRSTRKFANLGQDPRAAMLMDSRTNTADDIYRAAAVTAVGSTRCLAEEERNGFQAVYLAKHPHLAGFVGAPSVALMEFNVDTFYWVTRFQSVTEIQVRP